jgi:hypothetical protein
VQSEKFYLPAKALKWRFQLFMITFYNVSDACLWHTIQPEPTVVSSLIPGQILEKSFILQHSTLHNMQLADIVCAFTKQGQLLV